MIVPLTTMIATQVARTLSVRDCIEVTAMLPDGITVERWACEILDARDSQSLAVLAVDDIDQMGVPVPIAMGGIRLILPWLATVWFVGTDRKLEGGADIFRVASRLHSDWRARGVRKFQCACLHSPELSSEWLERLGYRREGLSQHLGRNGEDFVSWGRE